MRGTGTIGGTGLAATGGNGAGNGAGNGEDDSLDMEALEDDLGRADGFALGDEPAAVFTGGTGIPPCRSVVSSCRNIGTAIHNSFRSS